MLVEVKTRSKNILFVNNMSGCEKKRDLILSQGENVLLW